MINLLNILIMGVLKMSEKINLKYNNESKSMKFNDFIDSLDNYMKMINESHQPLYINYKDLNCVMISEKNYNDILAKLNQIKE